MKQPPYSYTEAKMLCEEFQYIKGSPFRRNSNIAVDAVVMSPFDPVSKNRFIMLYLVLNDAKTALIRDYFGAQYDVLVVTGSLQEGGMQHQDIYTWLNSNSTFRESSAGKQCTEKSCSTDKMP